MSDPVILLSSERSGSNLIRVMMDSHPQFAAPHSPHLIKTFLPVLAQYGRLSEDQNLRMLAEDMIKVVEIQLRGWRFTPSVEDVVKRCQSPTFSGLLNSLYLSAADHDGKSRCFIKDNGAIPHAFELSLLFPDAKFVYMVRDPRDVALSWKKSPGHPGGVRAAARMWRYEQDMALRFLSVAEHSDRIHVVRYERLVSEPETGLKRLCEFLDTSFEPAMLEFFSGKEATTSANAAIGWKNLVKPVMTDNFAKYRAELSSREQRIVERIAGRPLEQLGYELDHPRQSWNGEADLVGKLWRAGRAAVQQLARGREGIQELKQRTHRLKGLRNIAARVSSRAPVWFHYSRNEQQNVHDGGDSETTKQQ